MITTARLRLRPFTIADAPKLLVMSHEAGLVRFIPDQVYRDLAHAEQVTRALIAFTDEPPDPKLRPFVMAIDHADTGVLIGHVGLSAARGSVEVGYAIEARLQGNGFATEAVRAMCRWGIGELLLPDVLGIVDAENLASRRVLEKAGFEKSGEESKRDRKIVVYRCHA